MLTKVEVDDLQGHTLSLPLQDNSSGYTIKDISGLDPVKATIVSSSFAQLDGSQFQGSRRENRNIILSVAMEPYYGGPTVKSLRAALYAYFMPKTNVNIKFYEDGVNTVNIQGQIESCETALFSKDPEVNVSILCFDPSFVAPSETVIAGNTVSTSTEQLIVYPGTVEVGYVFTLNVNRAMSGFSIFNRRPNGEIQQMDFALALAAADVVKISTVMKDKYVTLTKAGSTTNIMYAISTTAKWGPLYPGNNYFRVLASGAAVPFTLSYTAKYGGL